MTTEQTLETLRLRLLRLVAGLLFVLGFLSVGAGSRGFSDWVFGYVGSVLSRAELAVRYLLIAQAKALGSQRGYEATHAMLSEALAQTRPVPEDTLTLADCRARLRALQAVLENVPRHALRLLRRISRQICGTGFAEALSLETWGCTFLRGWRLAAQRIERPPDKRLRDAWIFEPLPGLRAGGVGIGRRSNPRGARAIPLF